jgi:hypothetical protein
MTGALKHRVFGTRALARTGASELAIRGWRPQGFDFALAAIVFAAGLAAAYPLFW